MSSDPQTLGACALALSCGMLYWGLRAGRKQRLLDDTPVSKALGVFIGEVEIEGDTVWGATGRVLHQLLDVLTA